MVYQLPQSTPWVMLHDKTHLPGFEVAPPGRAAYQISGTQKNKAVLFVFNWMLFVVYPGQRKTYSQSLSL